jgi:hypothetical protein
MGGSINVCRGERSISEANALVIDIEHSVKAFEERDAVDKLESCFISEVVDDEVHTILLALDKVVERPGPNLGVRGELECPFTDSEEERLKVGKLCISDAGKSRV